MQFLEDFYTSQRLDNEMDRKALELLQAGLAALQIEDQHGSVQTLLSQYVCELETFNTSCNLIKVKDTRELVIKHIFDSLAPWQFFARCIDCQPHEGNYTIADIGSGSGLPGIPLACLFLHRNPSVTFTLIERMHKRCAILENIKAMLNLHNTTVLEMEAERSPADYFDIAVFRALKPLDHTTFRTLQKRIRSTGILAAYKGRRIAFEEEMQALQADKPVYRVIPLCVPFYEAERNLVVIEASK